MINPASRRNDIYETREKRRWNLLKRIYKLLEFCYMPQKMSVCAPLVARQYLEDIHIFFAMFFESFPE
jgi:hypothetical protein